MPDLSAFRVLSFDCYGTLIDWESGILDQIRPWTESQHRILDDAEILEVFGLAEAVEESENPASPYPQILRRVHRRLAKRWGLPPDDDAEVAFGSSVGRWPPFSDSHSALVRLGRRYRLVILSNVDRASFTRSNDRLGVEFEAIYTAEDIGSYKPDPANFAYLIEREATAGYSPDEILHVGQSLYHDHVPASAAGLATCWIQRPSAAGTHGATRPPDSHPDVDFHFTSLTDLARAAGV